MFIQDKLSDLDLWCDPYMRVKEALRSGRELCDLWVRSCDTLTEQIWRRYVAHQWTGEKFVSDALPRLTTRLEEVSAP